MDRCQQVSCLQRKVNEAWELVSSNRKGLGTHIYRMIKQFGDVVCYYSNRKETANAYAAGTNIIENLWRLKEEFKPTKSLYEFFINLLEENAEILLIEDLVAAAIERFGESFTMDLSGISGVVEFIKSGNDKKLLTNYGSGQKKSCGDSN